MAGPRVVEGWRTRLRVQQDAAAAVVRRNLVRRDHNAYEVVDKVPEDFWGNVRLLRNGKFRLTRPKFSKRKIDAVLTEKIKSTKNLRRRIEAAEELPEVRAERLRLGREYVAKNKDTIAQRKKRWWADLKKSPERLAAYRAKHRRRYADRADVREYESIRHAEFQASHPEVASRRYFRNKLNPAFRAARAAYNARRYKAMKAGTWKPRVPQSQRGAVQGCPKTNPLALLSGSSLPRSSIAGNTAGASRVVRASRRSNTTRPRRSR